MRRALLCVCLHTQYTRNTPRPACHLTNQRTAGTQGSRSVKSRKRQTAAPVFLKTHSSWNFLLLCFSAFFDKLSTDLFKKKHFYAFHGGLNPTPLFLFLPPPPYRSVLLLLYDFATICRISSGCLATGSCLSQQVPTLTVARREPGNKDIRCYFPLLVCGHFHRRPMAIVCVCVCVRVCTRFVCSLLLWWAGEVLQTLSVSLHHL